MNESPINRIPAPVGKEFFRAKLLVSDELWDIVQPLLPAPKPRRTHYPGRKPITDRKAVTGILFILKTGMAWEELPRELGCGSGMPCWCRLRDWQAAGVWALLQQVLLSLLQAEHKIDWSRALVDRSSVRAVFGRPKPAPTRRIAPKRARNSTSSRMPKASRWPRKSPPPMSMM